MRRWVPVLVLAFVVGALFRLGNELGVAVLRMFGTQGIVIIGILVAVNLKRLQAEDGLRRLEEQLQALPDRVRVQAVRGPGRPPLWLVEADGRRVLVGTSDLANSVGAGRAWRLLCRRAEELAQAARAHGLAPGEATLALVLLRRRAAEGQTVEIAGWERPVVVVNPENVGRLLASGE
ncbi:MAG: hypothetical protein LOD85_07975 [Clostridia bacterium]